MGRDQHERVPQRLSRLCHRALDLETFHREAERILQPVLRHDGICWLSIDPRSHLPTTITAHGLAPPLSTTRELVYEYTVRDFNQIPDLLGGRIAAGLAEATDEHPERSPTFRDILDPDGTCWGGASFYSRRGQPGFDPTHAEVLRAASPYLAEGVRRALMLGLGQPASTGHTEAGVILLDIHHRIETMNAPARALLDELLFVGSNTQALVRALANRARLAATDANAGLAHARAPTASGAWLTLHGSILETDGDGRVVIIIEPAHPRDLLPLALDAYGLTDREREITTLVTRGLSAPQIGRKLFLSQWTVKDHLKTIFAKVGVTNRAELVAAIHLRWALAVGPQGHEDLHQPADRASSNKS